MTDSPVKFPHLPNNTVAFRVMVIIEFETEHLPYYLVDFTSISHYPHKYNAGYAYCVISSIFFLVFLIYFRQIPEYNLQICYGRYVCFLIHGLEPSSPLKQT
jgi:hypothetical protein